MKRIATVLCMVLATASAVAQTAREEIKSNRYLAASNYLDYDNYPATKALTPTPEGYEPYLMNHYGRHGSRWLISEGSYSTPLATLQKAQRQGKLTERGEDVLRQVEAIGATSVQRLGDLSSVGERQHHGIGRRMVQHFPEIFCKKGISIDARSTVVIRCILSMTAECEELAAANPTARFHNDVSQSLQYYLNQPRDNYLKEIRKKTRAIRKDYVKAYSSRHIDASRLMGVLFNDSCWAADSIKGMELVNQLFEIATNMQSHDVEHDLYPLFTDDEIYHLWHLRNIGWYLDYGPSPVGDGVQPFSQRNLLRDIIQVADTTRQTAAVLRFGHEVCVMPLACLLELDSCGYATNDLEKVEQYWRNYKIFPMACNIQLVFYRPISGKGDILVKALLNEREVSLPVKTKRYPYYRWSDLRKYYVDKLDGYDRRLKAFEERKQ